jgi:hypothetical protein
MACPPATADAHTEPLVANTRALVVGTKARGCTGLRVQTMCIGAVALRPCSKAPKPSVTRRTVVRSIQAMSKAGKHRGSKASFLELQ